MTQSGQSVIDIQCLTKIDKIKSFCQPEHRQVKITKLYTRKSRDYCQYYVYVFPLAPVGSYRCQIINILKRSFLIKCMSPYQLVFFLQK